MATPIEDIDAFLETTATSERQRVEMGILFCDSMLRELRAAVLQWEQASSALQEVKLRTRSSAFN